MTSAPFFYQVHDFVLKPITTSTTVHGMHLYICIYSTLIDTAFCLEALDR